MKPMPSLGTLTQEEGVKIKSNELDVQQEKIIQVLVKEETDRLRHRYTDDTKYMEANLQ